MSLMVAQKISRWCPFKDGRGTQSSMPLMVTQKISRRLPRLARPL
jgi:hypothetical protein